ncbi:MAG TPA: SDR family NAD(P)-dependent oxidoreductase [Chitinophagaceae bacterium]|nr:SDR family NAD(P)-dependent oxidoreductase [Chitinophagaceae bacterium]
MNRSNNKILITGGGTGIGLGLTERFLSENNTVIICGRREEILKEAASKFPGLITRVCDVANEDDRNELYNWISNDHPDLNVFVNNAGIQNWMDIGDEKFFEKAKQEVEINILAPLHLTSLFSKLPSIKTIINITSGLAFSPLAKVPVYCATKAFFHSFTLSARYLLQQKNIEVIEIIPPALNTDLGGKGIHDFAPPVQGFIDAVFEQLHASKKTITYGMSDFIANAGGNELKVAFEKMNPPVAH